MYKQICAVVALILALVFNQGALAKSWGCGEGLKQMLASMKLDADQQAKIKPIMDQLKTKIKTTWSSINELDKQIKAQVNSDKMDSAVLSSLVDQKAKLIGEAMKAKLMAQNQAIAVLTAEQKTALQAKLQVIEDKMTAKFKSCHNNQ